jgi:hypothetical protein
MGPHHANNFRCQGREERKIFIIVTRSGEYDKEITSEE